MFFNKVRKNQVLLNKVDGKTYTVGDKVEGGFEAVEKLPESNNRLPFPETPGTVVVTEKNAICFRLVNDPNPQEKPEGYKVINGDFVTAEGEKVETGELQVNNILGVVPGAVVLVTSKGYDGASKHISIYEPEKDIFKSLFQIPAGANYAAYPEGDKVIIALSLNEVEKMENGDQVTYLRESKVCTVCGGTWYDYDIPEPIIINNLKVVDDMIVVKTIGDVDEKNIITEGPERVVLIDMLNEIQHDPITVNGSNLKVSRSRGGILVVSDKMLVVDARDRYFVVTDKCAEMADLTEVVDITLKDHALRITLSNKDLTEVKTLVKTRSEDKGAIYTVE